VITGRPVTVGAAFAAEQPMLAALPAEPFDAARLLSARVDGRARVCVRQSFYSVPARYAGRRLEVRLTASQVQVCDGGRVVACHERALGRYAEVLCLDHYLEVLKIKPGALRDPHWHPNANEWQYYVKGRARMTVFGSTGRASVVEFGPGDVGYVPRGFGHSIENIGNEACQAILTFDDGNYQEISISDWVAATPRQILATNFGVPESTFANFSDRDLFIAGGGK